MAPIETVIKYDNKRNAVILTFNGKLESIAQIEIIIENLVSVLQSCSENGKVWCITDFTGIMSSGYSVSHFIRLTRGKLVSVLQNHTLGRIAIVRDNPNVQLFVSLFGNFIGTKAHICQSFDEAIRLLDNLTGKKSE